MDALIQLFLSTIQPEDIVFGNFRHGQKDGDNLTDYGRTQIRAAVEQLYGKFLQPAGLQVDMRITSPKNRTKQASEEAAGVLGISDVPLEIEECLNPFPLIEQMWPGNPKASLAHIEDVRKTGDNVGNALATSEYARAGLIITTKGFVERAATMKTAGKQCAIGFSHSPWVELTATAPSDTLWGLIEASCMLTIVRDGKIVLSIAIPPPLEGKRN